MFRYETIRRLDFFGAGVEISVQYNWISNENHDAGKRPTGVALIMAFATREFRLGYFWG
jgi:hypothetical protein